MVESLIKNMRPVDSGFLILDFGSQYTMLIARRMRELGYYSEIVDGQAEGPPEGFHTLGLILSGGPDSVQDRGSRPLPDWVLELGCPVLGICYGMQLLVRNFGGDLHTGSSREYGGAKIRLNAEIGTNSGKVLHRLSTDQQVWMSHGDTVTNLPDTLLAVAYTSDNVPAIVVHKDLPLIGIQFHPEVEHTTHGREILNNFARELCDAPRNWDGACQENAAIGYIRDTVGDGHVLVACSGGVDSTVAAALLAKAMGPERVTAVFCNHGLMRKGEVPWVSTQLQELGLKHVEVLDAEHEFLKDLEGVTEPEAKRKRIGRKFIEVFERYGASHQEFTHLGQGTLYPDVIESAGHGAGSKVIKSHHNVGGLPETLALPLVEPLRFLFKDEVRQLGERLGLPHKMVYRHPFPGPGLAIRILGEVTDARLDLLREADDIFIKALHEADYYEKIWQAYAALLPVKSVGVMGDNRTYQMTAALRAVTSSDAMTAEVSDLPISFLSDVAGKIVRQVDGINRVVYDITTKPPATIEWE